MEHGHALTEAAGLAEEVRAEQNGAAVLGREGGQEVEDVAGRLWVEARRGLVEEKDVGLVQEGAGQGDALALTGREPLDAVVGAVGDAEALEQVAGLCRCLLRGEAAHTSDEDDVLEGGEALVEAGLLGHHARAPTDVVAVGDRVEAEDAGAAAVGRQQAVEEANGRRLARPVGTEEGDDLAGVDVEGQAVEGLLGAEGDGQVLGVDGGSHVHQCGGPGRATSSGRQASQMPASLQNWRVIGPTSPSSTQRRRGLATASFASRRADAPATYVRQRTRRGTR